VAAGRGVGDDRPAVRELEMAEQVGAELLAAQAGERRRRDNRPAAGTD
jgi:hypothetical protein